MSNEQIKIGVVVNSNGTTDAETKKALGLKAAFDAAASSASKISGTSGSRAMAAKAAPTGSELVMQDKTYNQMRGSAGLTGASARDFANQSQGLGGLVRLYATFAANLFAATAAFTALKNAADTTNLVKGLDQLGARSGVALGTLSKQLVEVTEGAISMRDAMESVAKATSSGLASDQVLRLGTVAKQASQALGLDMTDALNRLTRGISKLEPELLDELGIFTKIDPAVQEYAKSIGRAASSLTDFERRQAFAIAVLEEGERKFNAIKLDSNPYGQLLATLKDVGQTVLEVVNKAIVPLVQYLSSSPNALLTVLGAIGAVLVKQALPAVGQFRAGLESAAEAARDKAIQREKDIEVARDRIRQSVIAAADKRVEDQVEKVNIAEAKINAIKESNVKKQSALYKVLQKDLEDVTTKDLKRIDASAKALESRGLKDQAKIYREAAQGIRDYQQASIDYQKIIKDETDSRQTSAKAFSIEGINRDLAAKASNAAVRSQIVANAAYTASLVGVRRAFILLNAEMTEKGITGFQRFTTTVKGGAAIIGGALSTIGAGLNKLLGAIGLIATFYSIFDAFADGASKQTGKFTSAIDKAESSVENLKNTYKALYEEDPFSTQAVQARGNALQELSRGFESVRESASAALVALQDSSWSRFKDRIKGIFNADISSSFGKSIAEQLMGVLESIDDPKAQQRLQEVAKAQLGIAEINFDSVAASARSLGPASKEVKALAQAIKGVYLEAATAGAAAGQFAESFKKVADQIAQINQKFAVSDDLANFAINSSNALESLGNLLKQDITQSVDGLVNSLEGIRKGNSIFGAMSMQMSELADSANTFKQQFSEGSKEVRQLEKDLKELNKAQINESEYMYGDVFDQAAFDRAVQELNKQRALTAQQLADARSRTSQAQSQLELTAQKVQAALPRALASQTELLAVRLAGQLSKGANQFLQGVYASFDSVPELVAKSSQLKLQEIDAQIANTKALRDLTVATVISAAQQKVISAQANLKNAKDFQEADVAQRDLAEATQELELLNMAAKNPQLALARLREEQLKGSAVAAKYGESIRQLASKTVEYNSALNQQNQQRSTELLQGQIAANNARSKQQQNSLKLTQEEIKLEGERLQLQISQENIGLDAKQQLTNQIALNKEKQIELDYQQRIAEAARDFAEQAVRASALPAAEFKKEALRIDKDFQDKKALAAQQKSQALEQNRLATLKQQSDIVVERITREETAYNNQQALDRIAVDSALSIKQIKLETEQGVEAALLQNLSLTAGAKAVIEYQAALRLAGLESERQKIQANAEFERQAAANTFAIRKLLAKDTGEDGISEDTQRQINNILAQESAQKASRDAAIRAAEAQYNKTVAVAGATKDAALRQDEWNEKLQVAADIAGSLRGAFEGATGALGQFGQNVGGLVDTLAQVADQNKKNADSMDVLNKKSAQAEEAGDWKAWFDLQDQKDKLAKKSQRDEINGYIQTTNAAKKMFKEKTVAYKLLDATEKAMHIWKMASFVRENAAEIASTVVSMAASAKKMGAKVLEAGVDGVAAVVKAIASVPFPLNIAAGAATAAAVAALLSKIGGKGPGAPSSGSFVPTAEQNREVQGTAMSYDSFGNKIQTSRGVYGDPEARSKSIENSIKILKDTSLDGLSYDNEMIRLLTSIDNGINKTANQLMNVPGLRTGSLTGVVEGTEKTPVSTFSGNIGASSVISYLVGGPIMGTLVSKGLDIIAGWLGLGKKVTTEIVDSGLLISGKFSELSKATENNAIRFFETMKVVTEGYAIDKVSWKNLSGKFTYTTYPVNYVEGEAFDKLAPDFRKEVQNIFTYATENFVKVGQIAGKSRDEVVSILDSMDLGSRFTYLRDLKGDEIKSAFSATINKIFDDAALILLKSYTDYAKENEALLETVIRVQNTNTKVNNALLNTGNEYIKQGGRLTLKATNHMEELFGGLSNFISSYSNYIETFFTKQQQIEPVTKSIVNQLTKLGFASVGTKDQFVQAVASLDLTTESGRNTYVALMELQQPFAKVIDYMDELKQTSTNFSIQIAKLTGRDADALAMERQAILDKTDDLFKPTQRYIFALEDVKTAQDNLTKARDREKSSLSSQKNALTGFLTNIKNFTDGLLLGSQSILTPLQKYTQAKDKFQELLTAASAIPSTEAEIKARDDAANQLSSAASAYLDASRAYNASSEAYTDDFNLVQEKLSGLSSVMTDQLATIDDQVNALTDNTTALETVAEATEALATALANRAIASASYTSSQSAIGTASSLPTNENKIKQSVTDIYQSAFGRSPDTGGLAYWSGRAAQDYFDSSTGQVDARSLAQEIWASASPDDKVRAAYWKVLGRREGEIDAGGFQYWTNRIASGSVGMGDFYAAVAGGATGTDVAKAEAWKRNPVYYARGGYASSGWAMVGEQGPELVDFQSPGRVYTAQQTQSAFAGATANMAELVQEVKRLNQEVQRLQQVVADGSMMNVQATERNTQEITQSVKSAETSQIHVQQISRKVAVV